MDNLTERLKEKKLKEEAEDPNKKEKIMKMHAEGDEINFSRCESCDQRFPSTELIEINELYYCSDCVKKIKTEQ